MQRILGAQVELLHRRQVVETSTAFVGGGASLPRQVYAKDGQMHQHQEIHQKKQRESDDESPPAFENQATSNQMHVHSRELRRGIQSIISPSVKTKHCVMFIIIALEIMHKRCEATRYHEIEIKPWEIVASINFCTPSAHLHTWQLVTSKQPCMCKYYAEASVFPD